MNITLLGAAGFIGTNLTAELSKNKNDCINAVDKEIEYFQPLMKLGLGNVNYSTASLDNSMDFDLVLHGQDIVYHLVSTTIPGTSNQQVPQELTANVVFTSNLLEACVRNNVKRVVFVSSGGTVYGTEARCPISEEANTYPINSYGLQKITIEKLLYVYKYMCNLDYRVIRLANPYGPYQRPNGVLGAITTFTYNMMNNKDIVIYGDGSVVRDFIYIDDAIKAIINIANSSEPFHTYNVGSGHGTSINEALNIIAHTLSVTPNIIYKQGRAVDVPVNYLDITRYESVFGKLNPVDLSQGVRMTAQFLRHTYL